MKINKTKIKQAIKATEDFIANAKNTNESTGYGLTVYGCEKRNLREYNKMMEYSDTKEFDERLIELYKAI
jgi:hypothetical protein